MTESAVGTDHLCLTGLVHQGPEIEEDRYADLLQRVGTFEMSQDFMLNNPKEAMLCMRDVLVVRCEMMYMSRVFEYHAVSPLFDVKPAGEIPPTYTCEFTRHTDDDGNETTTFEWKKVER